MNSICLLTAIALLVVFASVSLFIPYAAVVFGAAGLQLADQIL